MTIQLYAQKNFHGKLKMTVNKKSAHFRNLISEFQKILLQSDAELPRLVGNDRIE